MTLPAMESTTLVTFMLHHSSARKVELLGSWDNFTEPYAMEQDRRRGQGTWSGCHTFRDIICDGDEEGIHEKRAGGLRMGGTYWYFYRIDDDEEYHDPSQETTTACPLMPGQTLNVLDVPFDVERFGSHSRSSSQISLLNIVKTLNPDDRYVNPKPTVKPQAPSKPIPSAEGTLKPTVQVLRSKPLRPRDIYLLHQAQMQHAASEANTTAVDAKDHGPPPGLQMQTHPFELQGQGLQEALAPRQGGRRRSRAIRSHTVSAQPSDTYVIDNESKRLSNWPLVMNAPVATAEMRGDADAGIAARQPLTRQRAASPHMSVRRVQEVEMADQALDIFPTAPERGRSMSNIDFNRPGRLSHRRGFSNSLSSRRSTSAGRKREPSPLRNLALTQDETRSVDDLAIPTCVPEAESETLLSPWAITHEFDFDFHNDDGSVDGDDPRYLPVFDDMEPDEFDPSEGYPPLAFSLAEPLFHSSDTDDEMHHALHALHHQYTHEHHYAPWQHPEFDIPLPESPELAHDAGSGVGSPTFSSINGDASDAGGGTHHHRRLSDLRPWPLHPGADDFAGFDFQLAPDRSRRAVPDVNRSFEHLTLRTAGTGSTTSTAVQYQLPNTNPFAAGKACVETREQAQRELTQAELLLDEFEYLGAALA